MIGLIDYGASNVGSVVKAVQYLGYPAQAVDRPELLPRTAKIIFPGQGHFGAMMKALAERRLLEPLRRIILSASAGVSPASLHGGNASTDVKPFLGICLGLQVLYEGSEEAPGVAGLGVLGGCVKRFEGVFKVPHVGWSQLEVTGESRILRGVPKGSFVYYCHSYYGPVTNETVAVTDYGQSFAAAVEIGAAGPLWAVQFHPEKSGEVGLRVLKNFLEL
jgi:imidazole glycerol phosphate synthase glutamine amidotransferase subunit